MTKHTRSITSSRSGYRSWRDLMLERQRSLCAKGGHSLLRCHGTSVLLSRIGGNFHVSFAGSIGALPCQVALITIFGSPPNPLVLI
jgi:hypothetical protein